MLALSVVFLAGAAAAPPRVIDGPSWIRKPTSAEVRHYYPELAVMNNMTGRAVLSCRVDATGNLEDCRAEEETPAGFGFGEAALKVAPLFQMKSTGSDGRPVAGGTVRIPITFRLQDQPEGMSAALSCYGATANRAEAEPNADNWYATRFWALQSMAFAGAGHVPPSSIERDLQGARLGAAARPGASSTAEACDRTMRAAIKK
jgi:TonB family protein